VGNQPDASGTDTDVGRAKIQVRVLGGLMQSLGGGRALAGDGRRSCPRRYGGCGATNHGVPGLQVDGWAALASVIREDSASLSARSAAALLRGCARRTAACGTWCRVKFVFLLGGEPWLSVSSGGGYWSRLV
jgi:hypothetical protein